MALVGNLKDLKLANIIQINCIERNVAKVTVHSPEQDGAIYFSNGAIVHAEFGPYVGERAVHEMLGLGEGEFKVEAGVQAPMQTITQPWNSVVLEGLRLLDERKVNSAPIPRQLFALLSGLKNVQNVFVLNYNGQVVEGKTRNEVHPLYLTFVWYKLKKMLNLFYSDFFQYIVLRKSDGYFFIFEFKPNLIVVETNLRVITPEFTGMVKKVLKQVNAARK
ncbi:MAG: DUF4388 domain-containing protein [Calditrichaeota bacterium]|nr:MAG: DUF4388 domain-containing protein [Calditrichota bacterium]